MPRPSGGCKSPRSKPLLKGCLPACAVDPWLASSARQLASRRAGRERSLPGRRVAAFDPTGWLGVCQDQPVDRRSRARCLRTPTAVFERSQRTVILVGCPMRRFPDCRASTPNRPTRRPRHAGKRPHVLSTPWLSPWPPGHLTRRVCKPSPTGPAALSSTTPDSSTPSTFPVQGEVCRLALLLLMP
jgi:hypothetical protein